MNTGKITKSRSKPRNILRGIIPTADATWDTTPTSLENTTDDNNTTTTGTGTKVVSGANPVGSIIYDLGSSKNVMVTVKCAAWTSAGAIRQTIDGSEDNITYVEGGNYTLSTAVTSESTVYQTPLSYASGRYIKVRTFVSQSATGNIKFYDVRAYEV